MSPRVWNKRDPNVPDDAVYVGRPSKWGNPFRLHNTNDKLRRAEVIEAFRLSLTPDQHEMIRQELHGKDLVCWCAPLPCHADVLLEIANGDDPLRA